VFSQVRGRKTKKMGRKDANSAPSLPIDSYRKQIGRYEEKKDRKGPTKRQRAMKDARSSAVPIKEIILLIVTIFGLVACFYVLFYVYMAPLEAPITTQGQEATQ